ncbi:MAG: hypothetical protein AB7K24_16155 [Gemmataceae bacterium]
MGKQKRTYIKVEQVADEVADRIIHNKEDHRFSRRDDGSVGIWSHTVFPDNSAPKQTLWKRRKTFERRLEKRLQEAGWRRCLGGYELIDLS